MLGRAGTIPNAGGSLAQGLLAWSLVLVLGCGCGSTPIRGPTPLRAQTADAVFYASIQTLEANPASAEAVAVRGGRISYVGDKAGVIPLIKEGVTRILDWSDHTLYPGFSDAHGHLLSLGRSLEILPLGDADSFGEVLLRLRDATTTGGRSWIIGRGWDQNKWPNKTLPDGRPISHAVPDRPVVLFRIDGHAMVVNAHALRLAGIRASTPDPDGGRIARDRITGEPTGLLLDRAMSLVTSSMPAPPAGAHRARVKAAAEHLVALGLTSVHDAGTSSMALRALEQLAQEGELPVRVYAMLNASSETGQAMMQWKPRIGLFEHHLSVRAIKLMADGSLGSRGALLTQPYSDDPENRGLAVTSRRELMARARQAADRGYQVAIHAIGDAGSAMALDVFEAISARPRRKRRGGRASRPEPLRPRLEHAQVVRPEDRQRMAVLRVIASMQPTHATSDMGWAQARLGPERIEWAYAWQAMRSAKVKLAFGSDFPVETASPLAGIHAAVTRTNADGEPEGGWYPEQRVSIEEAIRAYTIDAAYAAHEEELKGSIRLGKLADFTVLDTNLAAAGADAILAARVIATVVGGKVVYGEGSEETE